MINAAKDYDAQRAIDFRWFVDNLPELYKLFGECYLAIQNCEVIGKYNSYEEGVLETSKTQPLGTFIVQYCGSNESAYQVFLNNSEI